MRLNDLDFSMDGQGGFQGNQNIILDDSNPNSNDININKIVVNLSVRNALTHQGYQLDGLDCRTHIMHTQDVGTTLQRHRVDYRRAV